MATGAPSKLYADVLRTIFGMVGATAGWQAVKDWDARIAAHDSHAMIDSTQPHGRSS